MFCFEESYSTRMSSVCSHLGIESASDEQLAGRGRMLLAALLEKVLRWSFIAVVTDCAWVEE